MDYIFRGFHPDENGSKTIVLKGKKIKGKWYEGGFCYGDNRNESLICPKYDFSKEVIRETVGQYTGHTDVCNDKIFDGDRVILNDDQSEVYTVEWDEETARFVIVGNGVSYDFDNVQDDEIEVIGNKWEVK